MGEVSLLMSDSNRPETTAVETRLWGLSGFLRGHQVIGQVIESERERQIPPVRHLNFIIMINL